MEGLIYHDKPNLVSPYLVMGFEGWPDAGGVSSGVVSYLREKLAARKLAEIRPDDFYVFQSQGNEAGRPITRIEGGIVRTVSFPSIVFWFHQREGSAHDLIVSLGREPELRWNTYVETVLDLVREFNVQGVYTVGGTYDRVPHTIEPVITAVVNEPGLRAAMRGHGIGLTSYEGPSSIHTMLLLAARRKGISAASLWGHAPHYIQVPNARVCYSVLQKLVRMLGVDLDLEGARKAAEYLDQRVNAAIEEKAELKEHVKRLEEEYLKGRQQVGELLSEDILKEVEDFLQKKKDGEGQA